jgi:hypothetical protein
MGTAFVCFTEFMSQNLKVDIIADGTALLKRFLEKLGVTLWAVPI